jgi:hypothetical protein
MFFQNDHYVFLKRSLCFFWGQVQKKICADKLILPAQIIQEFFGSELSAFLGIGQVFQHVFNVFAGCEYHLCPSNG